MKFSIEKILAFLETEGWELASETSQYFKFVLHKKIFLSGEDQIEIFLSKEADPKEVREIAIRLSNLYENLIYHELLYAFSEDKTALTLREIVNENKFGIKEYSDFLATDFHASQITHFFEGFEKEDNSLNYFNGMYEFRLFQGYYEIFDGKYKDPFVLPLPRTIGDFISDVYRILGERRRLKFNCFN